MSLPVDVPRDEGEVVRRPAGRVVLASPRHLADSDVRGGNHSPVKHVDSRACRAVCGLLRGEQGPEPVLVCGVVLEALTPPGEEDLFVDDADALPFAGFPGHGHAGLPPIPDRAAGPADAFRGFAVGQHRHGLQITRLVELEVVLHGAGLDSERVVHHLH